MVSEIHLNAKFPKRCCNARCDWLQVLWRHPGKQTFYSLFREFGEFYCFDAKSWTKINFIWNKKGKYVGILATKNLEVIQTANNFFYEPKKY